MDKQKQGRVNRRKGEVWETKVRRYLENQGYVVTRWTNKVDLETDMLVPARLTPRNMKPGFPDFLAFTLLQNDIILVESKLNGYLTREEKEQCEWLLKNRIVHRILIISKKNNIFSVKEIKEIK